METMNKRIRFLTVLLAALMIPALALAGGFVKSVPIKDKAEVTIVLRSGDVVITGWDKNEVKIEAEEDLGNSLVVTGDTMVLSMKAEGDVPPAPDGDIELHVPKSSKLSITTVSGDLTAEGISERIKLTSVSGDVRLKDCRGSVWVKAVSGDAHVQKVDGDVTISTVSGDLKSKDIKGSLVEVSTVSGDLEMFGVKTSRLRMKTVSGDMRIHADFSSDGSVKVKTVSGDTTFYLPDNAGFDVSLSTRSGDFSSDFELSSREGSERHVTAKAGSGGTEISVTSLSGNLNVRKEK
jgi:hypothetical protein